MSSMTYNLGTGVCHGRVGRALRRGFTFTEVMFAVILLGIGFIMLAGMFPVAIQQTQNSVDDTTAAAVAQAAVRTLQQACQIEDFRVRAQTDQLSITPALLNNDMTIHDGFNYNWVWIKTRGNAIYSQDPRFAWVALYQQRADHLQSYVQVQLIIVKARNYASFSQ